MRDTKHLGKHANKLADEAKEKDSEIVQSTPGYEETIDWWSRGGPTEGKARQDKSVSAKSLQYWNGDLSAKMSNPKSTAPVERITNLTNEKNVRRIIKSIQSLASDYAKRYPKKEKIEVLDYKIPTIIDAATQIQNALNELRKKQLLGVWEHISKNTYIYIYIYMYVCMYVYNIIYNIIYIYIHKP